MKLIIEITIPDKEEKFREIRFSQTMVKIEKEVLGIIASEADVDIEYKNKFSKENYKITIYP